jgi:hypothetical protein
MDLNILDDDYRVIDKGGITIINEHLRHIASFVDAGQISDPEVARAVRNAIVVITKRLNTLAKLPGYHAITEWNDGAMVFPAGIHSTYLVKDDNRLYYICKLVDGDEFMPAHLVGRAYERDNAVWKSFFPGDSFKWNVIS